MLFRCRDSESFGFNGNIDREFRRVNTVFASRGQKIGVVSPSFFRFVRPVLAGGAKLRGRMTIGVLIAGPAGVSFEMFPLVSSLRFGSYLRWF